MTENTNHKYDKMQLFFREKSGYRGKLHGVILWEHSIHAENMITYRNFPGHTPRIPSRASRVGYFYDTIPGIPIPWSIFPKITDVSIYAP